MVTQKRVLVRYPNTNSFLFGSILKRDDEKTMVKCDYGCNITFNNKSNNILKISGSILNNKNINVLSANETLETVLKSIKPFIGNPVIKDHYEVGDRLVIVYEREGFGRFTVTVMKVKGNIYTIRWDNPKYVHLDRDVPYDHIIGLATDEKIKTRIRDHRLKNFLLQGSKSKINQLPKVEKKVYTVIDENVPPIRSIKSEDKTSEIIKELQTISKKENKKPNNRTKEIEDKMSSLIRELAVLNEELSALRENRDPEVIPEVEKQVEVKKVEQVKEVIEPKKERKVPNIKKDEDDDLVKLKDEKRTRLTHIPKKVSSIDGDEPEGLDEYSINDDLD